MLEIQYALLLITAIILLILGIHYEDKHLYWNLISVFLSSIIFLALAFGSLNIETPYQIYNVSSEQIETGWHSYGLTFSLMFLFLAFAVVEIAYVFIVLFMEVGIITEEMVNKFRKGSWRRKRRW